MTLILHELIHLGVGLIVGLLFYLWTRNYRMILISVFVSLFLDLDHLLDYFLYIKTIDLNPFHFFERNYFGESGKIYIFFHAYEYAIILLFLALMIKRWRVYFLVICFAMLGHLFVDLLSYDSGDLRIYSIIYRGVNNFGIYIF